MFIINVDELSEKTQIVLKSFQVDKEQYLLREAVPLISIQHLPNFGSQVVH